MSPAIVKCPQGKGSQVTPSLEPLEQASLLYCETKSLAGPTPVGLALLL